MERVSDSERGYCRPFVRLPVLASFFSCSRERVSAERAHLILFVFFLAPLRHQHRRRCNRLFAFVKKASLLARARSDPGESIRVHADLYFPGDFLYRCEFDSARVCVCA